MEESIFLTIKKLLGLAPDYDAFDLDILVHINSAFSILASAGATPPGGWGITGPDEKWSDFLVDKNQTSMVKTYITLFVKSVFDPSNLSFVITSNKEVMNEILWRLNTLELVFNPSAYDYVADFDRRTVWMFTTDNAPFPPSAKEGDLGYNPATGNLWRYR